MPRRRRPFSVTGLCSAAIAVLVPSLPAAAQSTGSVDLLQTDIGGALPNPQIFRRSTGKTLPVDQAPPAGKFTPSRIGAIPQYGSPPGFGASDTGFDSTNIGHRKKPVPSPPPSPAADPPDTTFAPVASGRGPQPVPKPAPIPSPAPEVYPSKAASRPGAVLPSVAEPLPVSNPPPQVYPPAAARRPGGTLPIPPQELFAASASTPAPGTPPLNTLPLGTAAQRPLPLAAGDPYAPLGLRTGSFLIYPALELSAGYDSNPQRIPGGAGAPWFVLAPELRVQSDWSRHSLTASIVGTYDAYGGSFAPSLNRPYLNATADGRIDIRRDTQLLLENRYLVSTDNPGSPNLQAGLAKLPIYTTAGATLGLAHQFNRLQITVKGTFDRSIYNPSVLTDGEVVDNADRDFNQYAGIARLGYELSPALKPFIEVSRDRRVYDRQFDGSGLQRDSHGTSGKLGADLDLFGSLSGEFALGYLQRNYVDPTLPQISGIIADGALLWQATALTSAKLTASSTVTESIVPGTSGALSRDVNVQVDHAFLRWLIGTLIAGYGRDDYVGLDRLDNRYFASVGFAYKLSRDLQLKGTVRQDWLSSNAAGASYEATSFLLGLRLQH